MRKKLRLKLWSLFGIFALVLFFVLTSYLVQTHIEIFENLILHNSLGLVIYIFINFLGVVVAPVTVLPLIVVAAGMWGSTVASVTSWIGWLVGSVVAFWIARRFGSPVVGKFISMEELHKYEDKFSILKSFWGIVFLRMVVPVEILSYGLGLFSRVNFWKYVFASAIGLLPVTFLLGYLGFIPFIYQAVVGLIVLIVFLVVIIFGEVRGRLLKLVSSK